MAVDHVGLTPPGQSGQAIEESGIELDGALRINPSGGLIGAGHPVGGTGVRQLLDAYRQVTETAGDYQVARATKRDALDDALVRARITAQLPLDQKLAVADVVIHNTGTRDELRARADEVLSEVCRRVRDAPSRHPA